MVMDERDFQQKLGDLIQQIGGLAPDQKDALSRLAAETKDRHARMKQTVGELQESLDYLRLSIKYVLFDLEATRRENQYLRKLLERQANPNPDAPDAHDSDHTPPGQND